MWDRIFTASVAASGIGFVVFLVGWYLLDLSAIIMAGATLIGSRASLRASRVSCSF